MNYFDKVKTALNLDVDDELLKALVFETSRAYDGAFTEEIRRIQRLTDTVIDTPTRKALRKRFYYGEYMKQGIPGGYTIEGCRYESEEVERVFKDCWSRLSTYDQNSIISTLQRRAQDLRESVEPDELMKDWLEAYDKKRNSRSGYSLAVYLLNQERFVESGYNENILTDFIRETYTGLENYRYMALVIEGEVFNECSECITWNLIYKAGIFAENFIQYTGEYRPFSRNKRVLGLSKFLRDRGIEDGERLAEDFYKHISTGYQFEDCYISDNQGCKVLLFKKIELDTEQIPCPACGTLIQRGNSYPKLFLRSWECQNPDCPERSKSGRGKRFDEYGVYRYFKLVESAEDNKISDELYRKFRRDIYESGSDWRELLIKEYTYAGERVLCNFRVDEGYNREYIDGVGEFKGIPKQCARDFEDIPLVQLFRGINLRYKIGAGSRVLKDGIVMVCDDSTEYVRGLAPGQIGTVITSPPYYNVREYSHWENLIFYLVDMYLNCVAIAGSLIDGGYYLYNIGDIVAEDNVYVVSKMSKRRLPMGFLSAMIFEIAGYTLTGNIIWDKGQVQSKRSSTVNLVSGYVKCVNCYEHLLVFRKGPFECISNTVVRITPVIKVNSKGKNTYGHTAPYPEGIVDCIVPYLKRGYYVLDPFLGSGTTLRWCRKQGIKGIGCEKSPQYFELCNKLVFSD